MVRIHSIQQIKNKTMTHILRINESNTSNLPPVESLGDGEFEGALWGSVFAYNGNKYQCKDGLLNLYPCKVKLTIKDDKMGFPFVFVDKFQQPELISLFD